MDINKPDNNEKLKNLNNADKYFNGRKKNKNYKKREIIKNDGRYLIYYDFSNS